MHTHNEPKNSPTAKMSLTSQKHRNFVAEPMIGKPVTALAGIGEVLGVRLAAQGFNQAEVVLGQLLILKNDQDLFINWIKDLAGANNKQAADCYHCLYEWRNEFL